MEGAKGVFPSSQILPFLDRLCSFSFFITNNHRTIKGSRFHSQVMMIIIVVVPPISIGCHHGGHSPEPNGRTIGKQRNVPLHRILSEAARKGTEGCLEANFVRQLLLEYIFVGRIRCLPCTVFGTRSTLVVVEDVRRMPEEEQSTVHLDRFGICENEV